MSVETASATARRRAGTVTIDRARSLARAALLGLAALTILAAVIRFYRIGHQGFWYDEAVSALLVHFSPGKMFGLLPRSESTPPLYYCIAWVWVRVFGDTETGLRSLSAVLGAAVVPVIYGGGARLVSRRTGLLAAALAACNPLLIWYSQEARAYELLVLLSGMSLLAFAHLLERPGRGWAAAWAIFAGLALSTEYYAILVVVPEAIWLLYRHRRSRRVLAAVGVVALWGVALIPLIVRENQNGLSHWIARIPLARRIKQIGPQFVIGFGSPAYDVLAPIAIALAIFGLLLLMTRAARSERRGAHLAGGIALAGLVINLLLIAVGVDDLLTRNLIALWIPAAIAVAAGFALVRPRLLGVLATMALCGIGLAAAVGVARQRNLQRPDWRVVAALLGPRPTGAAASSGRVILVQHYKDALPLPLYMPGLAFIPTHHARASELDVISISAPPGEYCWWGSACNLQPSRMQSYPIPGFRRVWRRRVLQFTVLHMVAIHGPVLVRATELEKLLRTTTIHQDGLMYQP